MLVDASKNVAKVAVKLYCEICHYNTCKLYNYRKHLSTDKHKNNENASKMLVNASENVAKVANVFTCDCGKIFKHDSSFYRHKKSCISNSDNKMDNFNTVNEKELIITLLNQNNQLQNQIIELCKDKTILNSNNNNCNINSNNKTFNLQVFLNETCKDAMNISDFVDSIKLQLSDLEKIGEVGFVNGISNIIVKNLKELDITERPVHCTDSKREIIYIKDENKWEKENNENNKIKKAIKRVANKNINLLSEFKSKYPDCIYSDSKKSDQYNKIIIEAFELDNTEKQEKIIKKIAKEVTIDKN